MAASTSTRAPSSAAYTGPYAALVNSAARSNGLDPWLLAGLLWVENRFRPTGASPAGAEGIAQIELPAHPGVTKAQADNPAFAIPWAANYLASLKRGSGGSVTRALAKYNAGPNASESTLRGAGTAYADQVLAARRDLRKRYGGATAADASGGILRAGLAWPLAQLGKIIGRPYQGTHRDYGNWESDNAVDIATPVGTPVFAVDNGVVGPQLGSLKQGGQLAGLRLHLVTGNDEFYYAHLSRLAVKAGQRVQRGQLLGYSGEANGVAHLHIAEKATFSTAALHGDSSAQNASFWSHVGDAVMGGAKTLPGVGPVVGGVGAGVGALGGVGGAFSGLEAVGRTFGRFLDDPAYPFLWLLFMLLGFALLYLGVTRLFGVKPTTPISAAALAGELA